MATVRRHPKKIRPKLPPAKTTGFAMYKGQVIYKTTHGYNMRIKIGSKKYYPTLSAIKDAFDKWERQQYKRDKR